MRGVKMLNYDKEIIHKLDKKNINSKDFWDFKDYKGKKNIHSLIDYPATMVPDMQNELIKTVSKETKSKNILDPFMGSGTVLVQGLANDLSVYGIDINPLAYLISEIKTTIWCINRLKNSANNLIEDIFNLEIEESEIVNFNNINKWFRDDIIYDLSVIRKAITKVKYQKHRKFFWLAMARLVKDVCNSRNSTFKLHVKDIEDIKSMKNNVREQFKEIISQMLTCLEDWTTTINDKSSLKARLYCDNSNKCLTDRRKFKKNSIDIICTSPPYGDNHTTVTYGQYSVLQLNWIDYNDLGFPIDKNYLDIMNRIDSDSLGGKIYKDKVMNSNITDNSSTLLKIYKILKDDLNREDKALKVANFYIDFYYSLIQHYDVLRKNGYAIYTVGDRNVNNIKISFGNILKELAEKIGFKNVYTINRKISSSKIASSIKEESVIILRKE